MQSEVRKVLEKLFKNPVGLDAFAMWWHIDTAERADAARREEPVQELRQAVAELIARWGTCFLPTPVAEIVRDLLTELNAIITTKPDTVENRQATASGPVHDVTTADAPKENDRLHVTATEKTHDLTPVHPVIVQQMREIAARAVRDAMPDVLDMIADSYGDEYNQAVFGGGYLRHHAAKLRQEREAGHAAAVAAVSDSIRKVCEAERKERGA